MCNIKKVKWLFYILLILSVCTIHPSARAASETGGTENSKPPLQIQNRTDLKIVIHINNTESIPKGISKQILATKNLFDQYQSLGMKSGKDFEMHMVFRADGSQLLLNDTAYAAKVSPTPAGGNPNSAILQSLHNGGVKMYECHVAMKLKGYSPDDLYPFSRMVASGIGAIIDFEKSGYLAITP